MKSLLAWNIAIRGGIIDVHCHCGNVFACAPTGSAHAWLPWVAQCPQCWGWVNRDDSERNRQAKEDEQEP